MIGTQLLLFSDNDKAKPKAVARNDVRTGDAAEALVKFKLLALGYDAHESRRDAAYDLAVDLHDGRVVRVQVKGCSKSARGRWGYRFVRGNPRTGSGSYRYGPRDFDVTACVALPLERVLFVPGVYPSLSFRTEDFQRPGSDAESWASALVFYNRNNKH